MKELNQAAAAVKNTKDSAKQNILGNFFNSCSIIRNALIPFLGMISHGL